MNTTNDLLNNNSNTASGKSKKESLIYIVAAFIAGSLHIYWTLPTYMMHIDSATAKGTIIKMDKAYVHYSYYNVFDNTEYEFSREIYKKEYDLLKDKQQVNIMYPRFFPANAIITEIDQRKSIIFAFSFHLLLLIAIIKSIKDLLNK